MRSVLAFPLAVALATNTLTARADEPATIDVDGFRPAVVAVPPTGDERPVVVALHGNYDRPEWQCDVWRGVVGDGAFIVCPRGVPRTDAPKSEDRWTWNGLQRTDREVAGALAALQASYGHRVRRAPCVLTGFSLGATLAARIALRHPERFTRLVVIEGGADAWTLANARTFASKGGARVLGACGQASCFPTFRNASWAFKTAGVPFTLVGTRDAGHTYDGTVSSAVADKWGWVVEGDPDFAAR